MATKKKSSKKAGKPVKKIIKKKVSAKKTAPKKSKAKKSKPAKKSTAKPKKTATKKKVTAKKSALASKPIKVKPTPVTKVIPPNVDYTKAITPLLDRLVVRVIDSERLTAGGLLIIPDTALMATGYLKAEVLAVGTGNKSKRGYLKPLDVKVGDKVLFAEHSGTKVQFNSEELHIIHEADVMGILEE